MLDINSAITRTFFLSLLLTISTFYFGTVYSSNFVSSHQNEGFYPSLIGLEIGSYINNSDIPMWSVSYYQITANYIKDSGFGSFHYLTDHPNPMSKMKAGLPIPIFKYAVSFGAEVPFVRNGSSDVVIAQEIYFHIAVVNSDTKSIVDQFDTKIVQDRNHNQLYQNGTIDYLPQQDKLGNDLKSVQNYSVFMGMTQEVTWQNTSVSRGIFSSGIFTYSGITDQFTTNKYMISNLVIALVLARSNSGHPASNPIASARAMVLISIININ